MTAPKFTVEQGEHGPEYFEAESKLAFTNASGTLQFTRGNAERREELEAWIKRHEAHTGSTDQPTGEASTSVDEVPSEHNKEVAENVAEEESAPGNKPETGAVPSERITLPIICPIVGASHLGDKDPAVVNWWRQNHPEEFKNRYSGRRIQSESGIIV